MYLGAFILLIIRPVTFSCEKMVSSSSLVTYTHNVPCKPRNWTTKQRRTYQRLLSGITRANNERRKLRVITLTSSLEKRACQSEMGKAWQVLRKRIDRRFGMSLEYFRLRTSEGNGVLHIVFKGGFIPHSWLKNAWNEIWKSPIVFIQAVRGEKRLARYIVTHYMAGHRGFMRQSWSWGWVYRGFVRTWRSICQSSVDMSSAVNMWRIILKARCPKSFYLKYRRKKRWRDGSVVDALFKQYPDINKLTMNRLEMVVRYLIHHKECDSRQTVLEDYFRGVAHRVLPL